VALVAIGMLRRLPPTMQQRGLVVGTVGVVLIALPSLGRGSSSVFGVVLVLGALVLYGFALNVAVPLQRRFGALPVLWRAQGIAFLCVLPLGVASWGDSRFTWKAAAAVLVLGVFGTAVAHYIMSRPCERGGQRDHRRRRVVARSHTRHTDRCPRCCAIIDEVVES
jgi:drug/metabolite transporter (DMT)-like permease